MFTLLSRWTLLFRTLPIRLALILFLCLLTVSASATVSAQQSDRTVTGLTLSSDGPGELGIRWNAATPEPVDYRVSWARSEDEYLTWTDDRGNAFPTANTLTVTDLDEGVEYKVRVRARYGGDGSGPWSEEVRHRVAGEDGASGGEPPLAPAGLRVSMTAHDRVVLAWDDPGDSSITGYQVLRRSRDGEEYGDGKGAPEFVSIVDDTGSAATTYSDGAVVSGKRYVYRIRARNEHGLSPRSSYANAETPAEVAEPRLLVEGEMTVGFETDENRDESIYGYTVYGSAGRVGELSDDDFQLDGRRVTLGALGYLDAEPRDLYLGLNHWVEHPFVLQIGERRLSSRHGLRVEGGPPTVRWTEQCVEWSEGDVVPYGLRLVATDDPAYTQAVDDASLGSLGLVGAELRPAFGPEELEYRARVGWEVEAVSVSARANAGGACGVSVSPQPDGEGRVALAEGENTLRVNVTAPDGETSRTYTITVNRAPEPFHDGAGLSRLGLSGTSELNFSPRQKRYQVEPEPGVGQTTVVARGSETGTEVSVRAARADGPLVLDDADADPDQEGHQVRLSRWGDTLVLVGTRSPDGSRQRQYVMRLRPGETPTNFRGASSGHPGVRAAPLPRLSWNGPQLGALRLDGVALVPAFAPDVFEYTVSVAHGVGQVTVVAQPPAGGEVSITPDDTDADTDGYQVLLTAGTPGGNPVDTLITVLVRSADGLRMETYGITVTRTAPPSNDATLSEFSLSGVNLPFQKHVTDYQVMFVAASPTVTITAKPSQEGARIYVIPSDEDPVKPGYQMFVSERSNRWIRVWVTAPDGVTRKIYVANIVDFRLREFGISDADIGYRKTIAEYSTRVPHSVTETDVSLRVRRGDQTTATISPEDSNSAAAGHQVALEEGTNTITAEIASADGWGTETYTLVVTRGPANEDVSLGNLSLDGVSDVSFDFKPHVTSYMVPVTNGIAVTTVEATPAQSGASVAITPADADGATPGRQVELTGASTTITVQVTASDGNTSQTYNVELVVGHGFEKVDTGWLHHSCGLRMDGTVECWGSISDGRGSLRRNHEGIYQDVVAGNRSACGVRENGSAHCWATSGELPLGELGAEDAKKISAFSLSGYCLLHSAGRMSCANETGTPSGVFQSVGTGFQISCGLDTGGIVRCRGRGGALGAPADTMKFMAVGGHRVCGIKMDDTLLCWEYDSFSGSYSIDEGVPDGPVKHVDTGYYGMTCAVKMDGAAECTGHGGGFGIDLHEIPPPDGPFTEVSVDHDDVACGLKTDRSIVCWGADWRGSLDPPSVVSPWRNVADLLGLELRYANGLELDWNSSFDPAETSYSVSVGKDIDYLTVGAIRTNKFAAVDISQEDARADIDGYQVTLSPGENVITVTVTSADRTATKTYTITITRAEA